MELREGEEGKGGRGRGMMICELWGFFVFLGRGRGRGWGGEAYVKIDGWMDGFIVMRKGERGEGGEERERYIYMYN